MSQIEDGINKWILVIYFRCTILKEALFSFGLNSYALN